MPAPPSACTCESSCRSQPVNLLIAWILIPCRCSSFSSCTSLPLNKFRNLLRVEWAPVYHVKGWGKFNRHYGDFCTGADSLQSHGSCHPVKAAAFRPNRSVPPVSSWPYWLGRG